MYRTILVPLDGSPLSERPLPVAALLARASGARLVLTRVACARSPRGIDPGEAERHAVEEASDYLMALADQLLTQGLEVDFGVPYTSTAGGIPNEILFEIALHQVDLVIMSTHCRKGLERIVYGSVAEAVLANSPAPILLVQPDTPLEGFLAGAPALRLLVPLDGTAFAEAALPHAMALAHNLDATLSLLYAITPLTEDSILAWPSVIEHDLHAAQARAEAYLETVAGRLQAQGGLRVQTAVRAGLPGTVIAEESQAQGIGLIVMATHARAGMQRLLYGSIAIDVLRHLTIPILLMHTATRESRQEQTDHSHPFEVLLI